MGSAGVKSRQAEQPTTDAVIHHRHVPTSTPAACDTRRTKITSAAACNPMASGFHWSRDVPAMTAKFSGTSNVAMISRPWLVEASFHRWCVYSPTPNSAAETATKMKNWK